MKIHGLLLLDKPVGLSSNAALQRVRRLFDADKAGHGGTLDPLASGLLPVLFGEACKLAAAALDGDKGYRARIRLGERTSTDDAEGDVIARQDAAGLLSDRQRIESALDGFRGAISQVPPAFSALKQHGRPVYLRARAGETVELAARPAFVRRLDLLDVVGADLVLDIVCSKGTYIRALARDLGETLGCGAFLAGLVRTSVGRFPLAQASALDALQDCDPEARRRLLIPLDALIADWPRALLSSAAAQRFRQGIAVPAIDLVDAGGSSGTGMSTVPGRASDHHDRLLAVFAEDRLIGLGRRVAPAAPPPAAVGDAPELIAPARVLA